MKYNDWLEEWLAACIKPIMKDKTFNKYSWVVKKQINPYLGDYDMKDLEAPLLQKYIAEMSMRYAASTVEGIMTVLKGSLRTAVKMGIVEKNFIDCIKGPQMQEKAVECFTKEEQKNIEEYIMKKGKNKLIGILLCLYTGIRIGELFALTWKNIDMKSGVLFIEGSCHDGWGENGYYKIIESPKTKTSKRVIPIPKQLMPYINKLKKETFTSSYVIYGKDKPISIRSYQKSFERLLLKLKIPHRGFHALRHTFATRALECGMDVKTLSEILGHKNPMVTLSRYTHSLMEHKSEMMNRVGELL